MSTIPRLLTYCVVLFVLCSLANAAPVTCLSGPVAVPSGLAFAGPLSCAGLMFSNIFTLNATGLANNFMINNITVDNGNVVIDENPGLAVMGHIDLFLTISGLITAADLGVGGSTGVTITERICANPIPTSGMFANLCTNAAQTSTVTPLLTLSLNTPNSVIAPTSIVGSASRVYVFKDIAAGGTGGLSTMNESFVDAVPEPSTFLLVGGVLAGLGLIRRRRNWW